MVVARRKAPVTAEPRAEIRPKAPKAAARELKASKRYVARRIDSNTQGRIILPGMTLPFVISAEVLVRHFEPLVAEDCDDEGHEEHEEGSRRTLESRDWLCD
jgi:hypothetical protein